MRYLTLISLVFLFLILPTVSAQITLKENTEEDLKLPCFNNGTLCSSSAVCNITLINPDGVILYNNQKLTNRGAFHNITLNVTDTARSGDYLSSVVCNDLGTSGFSSFFVKVTPSGTETTTNQSIFYIGVIFALVAFIAIFMISGFKLMGNPNYKVFGFVFYFISMLFVVFSLYLVTVYNTNYVTENSGLFQTFLFGLIMFLSFLLVMHLFLVALFFYNQRKLERIIEWFNFDKNKKSADGWDGD